MSELLRTREIVISECLGQRPRHNSPREVKVTVMGSVGGVGGDEKESVKNGEDRCCGSGEGGKDAEGEKERIGNVNCNERKREDGLNSRFGDLHSSKEKNNEIKEDSSSSSQMLSLLDEFTKIYAQRLDRVEQTSKGNNDTKYLQEKVSVLQSWVRDLGDQNAVLVATVEELEREAGDRVALLEDKLASMATVTRESCVSLRDHHLQVHAAVQDAEKDTQSLRAGVSELEQSNKRLCQDNKNLQQDISSLIQVISRARHTGDWDMDDVTFSCISPEQLFGPCIPISSSRRSSLRDGRRDFGRDYLHQLLEEHIRKDSSTIRSSLSNLQDVEKSLYGGKVTEKDLAIVKLRADLRCLQNAHEEANVLLMDRDKQIADLQAQVTDAQHELEVAQAERNEMNRQLQHLRNQTRNDNVEISRKDELIRQLRQQSPTKKDLYSPSSSSPLEHDNSKGEVEAQLSANIDLLTWRLTQLETESTELQQKYQALQATHSLCKHPTSPLHSQDSRDFSMVEAGTMTDNDISEDAKLRRLHNEVAEKAVLLRELQGHLSSSRQELSLKDETLSRVEAKLDSCRRDGGQREERLQQLTGQLTRLQLQVATTHGQAEQLRRQVEVKTEQIIKQEAEITSLSLKLKDEQVRRTCTEEENRRISDQLCGKEKEIADQKVTISGLQDALVKSKQACDELRVRLDADVSSHLASLPSAPASLATARMKTNTALFEHVLNGVTYALSSSNGVYLNHGFANHGQSGQGGTNYSLPSEATWSPNVSSSTSTMSSSSSLSNACTCGVSTSNSLSNGCSTTPLEISNTNRGCIVSSGSTVSSNHDNPLSRVNYMSKEVTDTIPQHSSTPPLNHNHNHHHQLPQITPATMSDECKNHSILNGHSSSTTHSILSPTPGLLSSPSGHSSSMSGFSSSTSGFSSACASPVVGSRKASRVYDV